MKASELIELLQLDISEGRDWEICAIDYRGGRHEPVPITGMGVNPDAYGERLIASLPLRKNADGLAMY